MTDRPIIFSAPMVRALLDGRKTQTRRKFTPPLPFDMDDDISVELAAGSIKPRIAPGDRLWVREAWTPETDKGIGYPPPHDDGRPIQWIDCQDWGRYWVQPHYRATDPEPELDYGDDRSPGCRWKPSIHMPRWSSRLTLTVTDVRVQRLQKISEEDARAEGCEWRDTGISGDNDLFVGAPVPTFSRLWDIIHKPGSWKSNPWVAAIHFETRQGNIDDCSG